MDQVCMLALAQLSLGTPSRNLLQGFCLMTDRDLQEHMSLAISCTKISKSISES